MASTTWSTSVSASARPACAAIIRSAARCAVVKST
jgi:hypothetical protein